MAIKPIAYSYWRSIKRGTRTFESIRDEVKVDVKALAKMDVENNEITTEDYLKFIGEEY